jgi:N-acetylmuramoyl-L-alanine amidase
VVAAPGSSSKLYRPNPGAIVVAIDPGHGGCLDYGVPDPSKRGVPYAEKTMTLGVGLALQRLLEAQGVEVVMTRHDDSALAGDDYPPLGCNGPPWRDVDGNGEAGFEPSGHTRTRDELEARIDLANLARADVLVSIHINSMTQSGVTYQIAATQTFYDDETPWGDASLQLAEGVQRGVVGAIERLATYERQDRHVQAVAYYLISRMWRQGDSCQEGGTWCKPHRALQMPGILSEVGSINLKAEQDLLVSDAGQEAAAEGIYAGLVGYFGERQLAVRYDALLPGGEAGTPPAAAPGDGPPFWAPTLPASSGTDGIPVRLTNTGNQAWPSGLRLLTGWETSDLPYLPVAPQRLEPLPISVPPLGPGESVELRLALNPPTGGRALAWVTLSGAQGSFSELGSPALQLATSAP